MRTSWTMPHRKFALGAFASIVGAFALIAAASVPVHAVVYGVKTCGSGSVSCFGVNIGGGGSLPPSLLFSFDEGGGGLTSIGEVLLSGTTSIDVDALAYSGTTLFGYRLEKSVTGTNPLIANTTASQLLSINLGTGAATAIGASHADRDIRGAAFDLSGNLWTVDSAAGAVLRIDPVTGDILETVTLSMAVSTVVDIAFRSDGTAYLADADKVYELNVSTGALTEVLDSPSLGYAGLAFSDNAPANILFGYEVNGGEDINKINLSGFATTLLYGNLLPNFGGGAFNAGRGDLAAFVSPISAIPVPAALPLFGTGLGILGILGWRRRRKLARAYRISVGCVSEA